MKPYRLLITGSRHWDDYKTIRTVITEYASWHEELLVVFGDARGADALARRACIELDVPYREYEANWRNCDHPDCHHSSAPSFCPLAGFTRNQEMVDDGADGCEVFASYCRKPQHWNRPPHWSHGTDDCAVRAAKAGIAVHWNTEAYGSVSSPGAGRSDPSPAG